MLATDIAPRFRALCAVLAGVAAAGGLAACGQQKRERGHRFAIALMEYRLRPGHIVAPPGHLHITVENHGRMTHNLVIVRPHPVTKVVTTGGATLTQTTTVAARTPDLAPGARTTLSLTLAPGRYKTASTVGTDSVLGTAGTLTVTSK